LKKSNSSKSSQDLVDSLELNPIIKLSSLDIVAYAYLKEELVNTYESEEV